MQNNINIFPQIETENYLLRRLKNEDAEAVFLIRSNKQIAKYIDRPLAKSLDDALQFIAKIDAGILKNDAVYWAICSKTTSKIVGTITLWQISEVNKTAEIGFELLPEYQDMGILQEVIPKVIEFGFNNLKLVEIIGEVAPDNSKSVALLKKYGFKLKSKLKNTQLYALTQN
ncbi:MAG: GNAT family N-acetyltransferase [Bacteroidetes bacterium]|nr:GNAT family N-acetyltransferase [Bacteroidota bacterium]MBU1114049.1 GNAT family N-acetyltransferase [Bacteroidota bacterium]MBU1796814.1 GNAT family N-acetyltransferase [Bacteroidota bacterium]